MRNAVKKISVIMQTVLSVIFVVLIVLVLAGMLTTDDFKNSVSYILLGTLMSLHLIAALVSIVLEFAPETLSSVLIYSEGEHDTKMATSNIKRIIRRELKHVEGVTIKNSTVTLDEKGLTLYNTIKIKDRDLESTVEFMRNVIAETFRTRMAMEFLAINFKILKYKYPVVPKPAPPRYIEGQQETADESNAAAGEVVPDDDTAAVLDIDTTAGEISVEPDEPNISEPMPEEPEPEHEPEPVMPDIAVEAESIQLTDQAEAETLSDLAASEKE